MKIKIRVCKTYLIALFFLIGLNSYSQKIGMGLSLIYNFQTMSFGPSIRAEIIKGEVSIVPQIAYYPAFNKITEFYAGASLHLNLMSYGDITMYGIANGSFNGWINYESSAMKNAKFPNWGGEVGLGLKKGKCLRPFMEFRYNFKWKEANLRLGIMYFFNCDKKNHRKKKAVSCPAYSN